ncbi:hypothetical protein FQN49_005520 [Arthroderma sp. PD_2]|nr:hypothetical protein FQN49_005520 [Arthroderma sp. PD_2]
MSFTPTDGFREVPESFPAPIDLVGDGRIPDIVMLLPWSIRASCFSYLVDLSSLSEVPLVIRAQVAKENWTQIITLMLVDRSWFSCMRAFIMSAPVEGVLDNCPEVWGLRSIDIHVAHLRQCNHPATMMTNGLSNIKHLPFDHPAVRSEVMDLLPRAVSRKFLKATKVLLQYGAEPSARDASRFSCIYIATKLKWDEGLECLLEHKDDHLGVDIDSMPASAVAVLNEDETCLSMLLSAGADLHHRFWSRINGETYTLATYAVTHSCPGIVKCMINHGLADNVRDEDPENLIMLCIREDNWWMLLLLLVEGWTMQNVSGETQYRHWTCSDALKTLLYKFKMWPTLQTLEPPANG